jgi:hypothetical protein
MKETFLDAFIHQWEQSHDYLTSAWYWKVSSVGAASAGAAAEALAAKNRRLHALDEEDA